MNSTTTAAGPTGPRLGFLSWIGCAISTATCLIAALSIIGYRLMRTSKGIYSLSYVVMLGMAELAFLTGIRYTDVQGLCSIVAICLHYFILASFTWLLNLSLYLGHVLRPGSTKKKKVFSLEPVLYHFQGWLAPAATVLITVISRYTNYRRLDYCWLSEYNYMTLSLLLPAAFVVVLNLLVLLHVAVTICKKRRKMDFEARTRFQLVFIPTRASLIDCFIMLPLLTVTWFSAAFAVDDPVLYKQLIFCISNSLLGLIIFFRMCLLNIDMKRARKGNKISPYNNYNIPKTFDVPPKHHYKKRVGPMPEEKPKSSKADDHNQEPDMEVGPIIHVPYRKLVTDERAKILSDQEMKYIRPDSQPSTSAQTAETPT